MMDLQPTGLSGEYIELAPLKSDQFEALYQVAADPLIWEQHPSNDRYKRTVFESFFEGAMESKGAFAIADAATGELIGSSRFYEYDADNRSVAIGFTFLARKYWGTAYNKSLKSLMLNYAFESVDTVIFHIGANNIRSQKAIAKIGAVRFDEKKVAPDGQAPSANYAYKITKEDWKAMQQNVGG